MPETTPSRRDPTVDGLKFVAAGAIVMVHISMQPSGSHLAAFVEQISYSALYFFFLVSGYFHGALGTRGPSWLRKRFVRLAVPYAVWSIVFLLWWNLYHIIKGWPLLIPDLPKVIFFAGAAEVLWSLPWLFACAALAEVFAKTPALRRTLLVAAALIQLAVWIWLPPRMIPNFPIRQYIEGGRWVAIYVLGMELRSWNAVRGTARTWGLAAAVAALAAGSLAIPWGGQPTQLGPQIVMFCLNAVVAFSLLAGCRAGAHWFGVGRLAWGGDYLLGVYCSHALWLAILVRFVHARDMPVPVWLVFGWAVCFGLAVLVTRLLLSSRWTRLAVT
jgi:fucose 4-O-acetylase-like acetyltransferase